MNRDDFLKYLIISGCTLVRTDPKGYSIVRNVVTGQISGVPSSDPCFNATVCRICKTLGIVPPDCSIEAREIVEKADKKFGYKLTN